MIAIPAVGAGVEATWGDTDDQWLLRLHGEIPNIALLYYDHLTEEDRKVLKQPSDSAKARELYGYLRSMTVEDWAARFLNAMRKERQLFPASVRLSLHPRPRHAQLRLLCE